VRILFLNQYFPPDPAPTGVLFHELGEFLQSQGHTVEFVSSRQDYRSAKKNRRRMLRELFALGSIFFQGIKARRPDVVISGTSPPCLLVVSRLIASLHRAKSAHWLMDMYPELALALGEVRPGFVSRLIKSFMGWAYRRTGVVVALDDDMAARLKEYGVATEIIPPWVLKPLMASTSAPSPGGEPPGPEWTWIYSGNLGRAHEWETLLEVQFLLEKRNLPCRLLFQGGGPSWPFAQARAEELGLRRCDWKPYVQEHELQSSLLRARVLVITQRPETRGLLWPSKLALAITLPRPILWIGPVDGAIARMLRDLPHAGIFAPGQPTQIADWLQTLCLGGNQESAWGMPDALHTRSHLLERWSGVLGKPGG
jgi:hypothetical protein